MGMGKMAASDGGPSLSITNILSVASVLILAFGGGWTLFQSQIAGIQKQIDLVNEHRSEDISVILRRLDAVDTKTEKINDTLRSDITGNLVSRNEFVQFGERFVTLKEIAMKTASELSDLKSHTARNPVDKDTTDATTNAIDKRIDLIQAQITDINRQIAAALIIIDNNSLSTGAKKAPTTIPP
jgi:hypothetical protein